MEQTIERIKDYALTIKEDLDDDSLLDFIVQDVTNRALVYMNRVQLLEDEDFTFPVQLETVLAQAVVGVYKNTTSRNESDTGEIASIEDHGQKVSYRESVSNFLSTASDNDIFGGAKEMLDKFRLATVVHS